MILANLEKKKWDESRLLPVMRKTSDNIANKATERRVRWIVCLVSNKKRSLVTEHVESVSSVVAMSSSSS